MPFRAAKPGDEIVVCGYRTNQARYRLPSLSPAPPASGPSIAEWSLGSGVRAGIAASAATLPQGASSSRIMATVKLPF